MIRPEVQKSAPKAVDQQFSLWKYFLNQMVVTIKNRFGFRAYRVQTFSWSQSLVQQAVKNGHLLSKLNS